MEERNKHLFLAKLAEQAERYDDMMSSMKHVVMLKPRLSLEERNLLAKAFKNMIGPRRASQRTVSGIEQKEREKKDKADKRWLGVITSYRKVIEDEMTGICTDISRVLDALLPSASSKEDVIFYHMLKGDYFRYLGELKPESEEIRDSILAEYKQAVELTRDRNGLPPSHPIALGLLLNVTIFYYDVLREKRKAIFLTERGYDEAYRWHLDSIPHERYRDSVVLLQMLKDNLTMWKGDPEFLREQAEQKAIDDLSDEIVANAAARRRAEELKEAKKRLAALKNK